MRLRLLLSAVCALSVGGCSAPEFQAVPNSDAASGAGGSGADDGDASVGGAGALGSGGNAGGVSTILPSFGWVNSIAEANDQQAGGVAVRPSNVEGNVLVTFHDLNGASIGLSEYTSSGMLDSKATFPGSTTGSTAEVHGLSIGKTSGNPFVAGEFTGVSPFGGDSAVGIGGFLAVARTGGASKVVSGSGAEQVTAVTNETSSALNGVFIAGWSTSATYQVDTKDPTGPAGPRSCFVSKQFGTPEWATRVSSAKDIRCNAIATTSTEIVTVGVAFDSIVGSSTAIAGQTMLVQWFAGDGAPKDTFTFGSEQIEAWAVDSLSDGSIVVAGSFSGKTKIGEHSILAGGASQNAFVARINRDGDVLWAVPFKDAGVVSANALTTDTADNIFVVGDTAGSVDFGAGPVTPKNPGTTNGWAVALGKDGSHLWSGLFDGPGDVSCRRVDVGGRRIAIAGDGDSPFTLPGGAAAASTTSRDIFLAVYDY